MKMKCLQKGGDPTWFPANPIVELTDVIFTDILHMLKLVLGGAVLPHY